MSMIPNELIRKYNVPGPRYTSYPTVPNWSESSMGQSAWKETVQHSFAENASEGISLYIHLPYCESMCTFCGCHKHITKQHAVEEPYINALLCEWQLYLDLLPKRPLIQELHFGGGTPTFFQPKNLKRLVEGIFAGAEKHPNASLGFEGHPNNTSEEHLTVLRQLGFNRVSFGVQDYSPKVQQAINRIQSFEQVKLVHEQSRDLGYSSISHDLVFGLPHQRSEDIQRTIELTNRLHPDRISLYSYAHVPWIKGLGQRGFSEADLPNGETKRALYEQAKAALLENGYHEIGMDHFALETDELYTAFKGGTLHRNFMGYTTNTTQLMIGLGMSSISDSWYGFAQNVKTVKEYIQLVNQGQIPVFRGHLLSHEDLLIRQHILNLMCRFETDWDDDFRALDCFDTILEKLHLLAVDGLLTFTSNGLRVTEIGQVLIRNICMCFDVYLHRQKESTRQFSKTI